MRLERATKNRCEKKNCGVEFLGEGACATSTNPEPTLKPTLKPTLRTLETLAPVAFTTSQTGEPTFAAHRGSRDRIDAAKKALDKAEDVKPQKMRIVSDSPPSPTGVADAS